MTVASCCSLLRMLSAVIPLLVVLLTYLSPGHAYRTYSGYKSYGEVSWSSARSKCEEENSTLATVTSKWDWYEMQRKCSALDSSYGGYYWENKVNCWIGLNQLADKGVWQWEDNTDVGYGFSSQNASDPTRKDPWKTGEPIQSSTQIAEDCVMIQTSDWDSELLSESCSSSAYALCNNGRVPTRSPTTKPTQKPTSLPSHHPSTGLPTWIPTSNPTVRPTPDPVSPTVATTSSPEDNDNDNREAYAEEVTSTSTWNAIFISLGVFNLVLIAATAFFCNAYFQRKLIITEREALYDTSNQKFASDMVFVDDPNDFNDPPDTDVLDTNAVDATDEPKKPVQATDDDLWY